MDVKSLNLCLDQLKAANPTNISKATVETLLKIHRNIKFNENDPKYRKLKIENPVFKKQVWNVNPARDFMFKSGWIMVGNELHFHNDENLWYIINVLLEYRNITPHSSEWKEQTKIENLHTSKQKEEELRAKAALERQKEIEECQKEKLYRKQLSENVKKQIADDRKNRREFVASPASNTGRKPNTEQNPHYHINRRLDS